MKSHLLENITKGASPAGRFISILIGFGLVITGASLAIDTGSLWFYAGTILVFGLTVQRLIDAIRRR